MTTRAEGARVTGSVSGVNAAAIALYMGQNEESRRIAREIADRLSALPEADLDVWERAIVGEAYLLLGDLARAKSWYMKAVALDPAAQGPREIMRDQARRNLQYLGLPTAGLDDVLT